MSQPRPQRGRPKGTGINDTGTLRDIARLLAANPKLRPTTASKMLGIADPSVIRRLRDKYNDRRHDLVTELGRAENDNHSIDTTHSRAARQVAYQAGGQARASAVHVAALASAAARIGAGRAADEAGPYALWFGLGLAAAASAIEQQLSNSQQLTRLPKVASLLRQQVEMAELMMSLSPPALKRGVASESPVPAIVR
jgi:hypothetical protein